MLRRALATLIILVPVLALVTACASSTAPAPSTAADTAAPSLEGVWRVTSIVTTGANAVDNQNPLPSQFIFTRGGHYSAQWIQGTTPRPKFEAAKDPNKLTDAEKIARYEQWGPFSSNAGTYQINGTTMTRRPTVAKNETVMTTDPPGVFQFKIEGTMLTWVAKSAEGQPVSETTTTLVRVE